MTRRGDMRKPEVPRYSAERFAPGIYGVYDRLLKEWVESSYRRRPGDAERAATELNEQNGSRS